MAFIVPDEGETQILNLIFSKVAQEALTLKLFSNNYVPVETTNAAALTECAGAGYAAIALVAGDFTISGTTAFTGAQKTFTLTSAITSYGYYVVGVTSLKVYFVERFTDGPYIIPSGGGTIKVTLGGSLD